MAQRFVSTGSFFRDGRILARQLTAGANGTVLQCNSATPTGFEFAPVIFPPAENLATTLIAGNSAGSNTINMNSNKITSCADPTQPQDVATKNYVDTRPSNDLFYTNTDNSIQSVPLPTAAGQTMKLYASGLNPGVWSNVTLASGGYGTITAIANSLAGPQIWVGTTNGSIAYILQFSTDMTTLLSSATASFSNGRQAYIRCFFNFTDPGLGGKMFVGGEFDTVMAGMTPGGTTVNAYSICYFDNTFPPSGAMTPILVQSNTGLGVINGVSGFGGVNTIWAGKNQSQPFSPVYLILGGDFNNTAPVTSTGVSNLITVSDALNNPQYFNASGNFAVYGGPVVKILQYGSGLDMYIGGAFTTVGASFLSRPYFTLIDAFSGTIGPALIPSLDGRITDMIFSSRQGYTPGVILIAGIFNLSSVGGSFNSCYFNVVNSAVYPALNNPVASSGGIVFTNGMTVDMIVFFGTGSKNYLFTNYTSIATSPPGTYWTPEGFPNLGAGSDAVGIVLVSGSPLDIYMGTLLINSSVQKYTFTNTLAVATFRLPTLGFRSATNPSGLYRTASFSAGAGVQMFVSGAEKYWSPAGALTTGLTFS